jgi:hypothetical protein
MRNRFSNRIAQFFIALAAVFTTLAHSRQSIACNKCGCCRIPISGELEIGQGVAQGIAEAGPLPLTPGSWTLAILPDTQLYSQDYPQHFNSQTQFIANNAAGLNIKYVLHEGDIVNNNSQSYQWANARASMNFLNGVVPYAIGPGNHDYGPNGNASTRDTQFNSAT